MDVDSTGMNQRVCSVLAASVVAASTLMLTGPSASAAPSLTVTSLADSGPGTLREALTTAQDCSGAPYQINFNIDGGSLTTSGGVTSGVISLASALPPITCAVTIDGFSQPLASPNPSHVQSLSGPVGTGVDGVEGTGDEAVLAPMLAPAIELNGLGSGVAHILDIRASDVAVAGLAMVGSTGSIIDLPVGTARNVVIRNNVLNWTSAPGSYPASVAQRAPAAFTAEGTIDGLALRENLIVGTSNQSVVLANSAMGTGVVITRNVMSDCGNNGDPSGLNWGGECLLQWSPTLPGEEFSENLVTGAHDHGLEIYVATGRQGTWIYRDNTFQNNHWCGVVVASGAMDPSEVIEMRQNVARRNGSSGLDNQVAKGGVVFTKNATYDNAALGLDTNRIDDELDSNGNESNWIDYPVIDRLIGGGQAAQLIATPTGNVLHLRGFATPGRTIELFTADTNDGSPVTPSGPRLDATYQPLGFGQGKRYLTSFVVPVGTTATYLADGTTTPRPGGVTANLFEINVNLPSSFTPSASTVYSWTATGLGSVGQMTTSEFGTNFVASMLTLNHSAVTTTSPTWADGVFHATYTITVTNNSLAATSYDLNDALGFDAGVTVTAGTSTASSSDPAVIVPTNVLTGSTLSLVNGQNIAPGATHTYTVDITATLSDAYRLHQSTPSACAQPGGPGTAFTSGAGLQALATLSGFASATASACQAVPLTGTASVSGLVFDDTNHNGTLDTGETARPGITATLTGDFDGDGTTETSSVVTGDGTTDVDGDGVIDPAGFYGWRSLAPGSYTVTFSGADATQLPDSIAFVLGINEVKQLAQAPIAVPTTTPASDPSTTTVPTSTTLVPGPGSTPLAFTGFGGAVVLLGLVLLAGGWVVRRRLGRLRAC